MRVTVVLFVRVTPTDAFLPLLQFDYSFRPASACSRVRTPLCACVFRCRSAAVCRIRTTCAREFSE